MQILQDIISDLCCPECYGEVINVEPVSRYCRECFVNTRRLQDGENSLQIWREKYRDVCKLNC